MCKVLFVSVVLYDCWFVQMSSGFIPVHSVCLLSQVFLTFLFQATAAVAQANLLRQQEELERKAAELDRRERELQSRGPSGH